MKKLEHFTTALLALAYTWSFASYLDVVIHQGSGGTSAWWNIFVILNTISGG